MKDDSFKNFVLEQLRSFDGMKARQMFGGHGLYHGEKFFGIIHRGRLYFKTDDNTRADYKTRGMTFFQPNARQSLKGYYEVPPGVIEDGAVLRTWAERAVQCR